MPKVTGGSLVTVIMPAWNAEKTLRKAANSILMQTWQNIELIIVDDASDDSTWMVMKEIAESDTRVKIFRNKVNVGPYVSKNIGLMNAKGDWITGHDADDWAHPQRLENHLAFVLRDNECDASLTYMVRMESSGIFTKFANIGSTSIDGIARISSISAMFKSAFIKSQLGFWDSVRFGADSEMIARATKILGSRFKTYPTIGMVCLDLEGSLTNDNVNGIRTETGLSPLRVSYRNSWNKVHSSDADLFIDFPQIVNPFHDNEMHVVSYETQIRCIT